MRLEPRICIVVAVLSVLQACAWRGGEPAAPELLTGLALSPGLQQAVLKAAEVPIAQALVAERPGRIHLSFLGSAEPNGREIWHGASGSILELKTGRFVATRFLESELELVTAGPDPVARWLRQKGPLPEAGQRSSRKLQFANETELWQERREILSAELRSVAIQSGAFLAMCIRERLTFEGWPQRYETEVWADAVSREVLWVRSVVQPGRPEVIFERVVPIQWVQP